MQVEERQPSVVRAWRVWLLLGCFAAGFAGLGARLWRVQVRENMRYDGVKERQSLRRVEVPGLRGRILDRHGEVLADNRPSYEVIIYCEELSQPGSWRNTILAVDSLIDQLAQRLGLVREVSRAQVARHVNESRPIPLVAWRDVDFRTVAYLSEWAEELPGVEVRPMPKRFYPNGALAAHALGYVGPRLEASVDQAAWDYRLPDPHGRTGIERQYDHLLSGTSGEELLRVDSRVYTRERWIQRRAEQGRDVTLTLDLPLQRAAEAALDGRAGAVVALDPRNGDVLVLASAPSYDLNAFVPAISSKAWRALIESPETPLFNRAIQAQYSPGSVFKPFVAIAAQEQRFNPDTLFECTGIYTDYHCRLRCHYRYGHGELSLREAIMKSCNPYFCTMGMQVGIEAIAASAKQAGFGSKTGIDLSGEAAGLMPTPEWKKRRFTRPGEGTWTPADTALCSIGQGFVTATPLQVAHGVAALAAGGAVYRPRLVAFGPSGELQRRLPWAHEALRAVIEGMEMVVDRGTGQSMKVEGVRVAGKTGTAEYIDRGVKRKHVWSVAFAPIERPEIVVCAMLDNGIGGGRDAGPIVRRVLAEHFRVKAAATGAVEDETLQD